jgi:hypothetical protein
MYLFHPELEKITYEYLHTILLDQKYNQFLLEFNLFYKSKFSFSADLKKINKILLSLSRHKIHQIHHIIKVFAQQGNDSCGEELPNFINFSNSLPSCENNKIENFKIPGKEKIKITEEAAFQSNGRNVREQIHLMFPMNAGMKISLFFL